MTIGLDVLHGVVDGQAGSHEAARRVDVHEDGFAWSLGGGGGEGW